jgi:hypothetical protein
MRMESLGKPYLMESRKFMHLTSLMGPFSWEAVPV